MESTHCVVWNPQLVAVWNQCTALHWMESRPKKRGIHGKLWCHTPKGAIPYNSQSELMPYSSPSVLNKNNLNRIDRFRLFFGDSYGNRTHVFSVRGWCLNRLTNEPFAQCYDIIAHLFSFVNRKMRKKCFFAFCCFFRRLVLQYTMYNNARAQCAPL